jgi:hypothetical protein
MMMIALIVRFASDRVVEAGEAKAEAWSLAIAWACEKLGAPAPTRRPVLNGAGSVRTIVLCKTLFNSLARDVRLLSYPANFAADSSMPSSSSPPS